MIHCLYICTPYNCCSMIFDSTSRTSSSPHHRHNLRFGTTPSTIILEEEGRSYCLSTDNDLLLPKKRQSCCLDLLSRIPQQSIDWICFSLKRASKKRGVLRSEEIVYLWSISPFGPYNSLFGVWQGSALSMQVSRQRSHINGKTGAFLLWKDLLLLPLLNN